MKLVTIVKKLVIENKYDARTYVWADRIAGITSFGRRRLQSSMVWNGLNRYSTVRYGTVQYIFGMARYRTAVLPAYDE